MSSFWSIWVTVITLFSLVACSALLYWTSKNNTDVAEGEEMGHEFDGIVEVNNPLPKWWSWLFIFTLVFGTGYLLLFPGLGNFNGLFNWQSAHKNVKSLEESARLQASLGDGNVQYSQEVLQSEAVFNARLKEIVEDGNGELLAVEQLAMSQDAVRIGQRLYLQNCSQCHGSDARGSMGFPNLTDDAWLYGGHGEAITQTLLYGRQGNMPGWAETLGEDGIREMTSYVLSLSGRKVDFKEAEAGRAKFTMCAACHGADGKGNQALGAPNLTDNVWLYGGSRRAVEDTLRYGRNGVMPAWKDILGEEKVQLVSAYVWRLSNPQAELK